MLLLTIRGTPTLYYGDELGIGKVTIPHELAQDPWEKNEPGHGRDPARTPLQWDSSPDAGFTTGRPWLPLSPDHATVNVETLQADATSILSFYRQLIATRRQRLALSIGAYTPLQVVNDVLVYERQYGEERMLVMLNFGAVDQSVGAAGDYASAQIVLSTELDRSGVLGSGVIRANEGLILAL